MKRIAILLLLFSLAVFPFAVTAEETQGAEIPDTETENPTATLFDIRYYFEHRLLPREFYQAPEGMMETLRENGLYDRWTRYETENGFDTSYSAAEFDTREIMQDSGIRMMLLTLPRPESTLLCYRIYLCYDPETETAAFFTAEFDKYEGFFDEGCLICGWKPDGTHEYYTEGKILPEKDDPDYEKALTEEATAILELMREQIEADHPGLLIRLN